MMYKRSMTNEKHNECDVKCEFTSSKRIHLMSTEVVTVVIHLESLITQKFDTRIRKIEGKSK